MQGKAIKLRRPPQTESWTWRLPPSDASTVDYSREIRKSAQRSLLRTPDNYSRGLQASAYGTNGYTVSLYAMIGSGWGGHTRETVAEWAGGKRWIIRDLSSPKRQDAADGLDLPEADGRYLLIGAPPKPAKGIVAWRNRWSVGRRDMHGLTVVAGEGIDPASVKARLAQQIAAWRLAARGHLQSAEEWGEHAETARATLPALEARAERVNASLEYFGVQFASEAPSYRTQTLHGLRVWQINARVENRRRTRQNRVSQLAAAQLAEYANAVRDPLAIGVRSTRPDGTPHHHGPYSEAHTVGVPAIAPDYDGRAACGGGLHYIPLYRGDGIARNAEECVDDSLRYSAREYALWIVRATDAVMIDGHKAKARVITPLARVGVHHTSRTPDARKVAKAFEALQRAEHDVDYQTRMQANETRNAERATRAADAATATLKAWRKRQAA